MSNLFNNSGSEKKFDLSKFSIEDKLYKNNNKDVEISMGVEKSVAIKVENATKSYIPGRPILNNLSLSVDQGTIYGLLGASGCGKTTILSCIVGLKQLDGGIIKVFGNTPGSKGSEIPGPVIGFMPQETALYSKCTIYEIFNFFGHIYGMSKDDIAARMKFLVEFLNLPKPSALISTLSGGQSRRVSLAVSLIHEPKILILDEPTVGVDSLLREQIWQHLNRITKEFKTTILITTHYIEEATHSHKVGIMRKGRLLVEEAPQTLLDNYKTESLEKVFLKLCQDDDKIITKSDPLYNTKSILSKSNVVALKCVKINQPDLFEFNQIIIKPNQLKETNLTSNPKKIETTTFINKTHHLSTILALANRNVTNFFRTPLLIFVLLVLPLLQTCLTNLVIGHGPKHTSFGVINLELPGFEEKGIIETCKQLTNEPQCFANKISCMFFNSFVEDDFNWVPFKNEEDALKSVQLGNILGYITIPVNYTEHMAQRALVRNFVTNATMDGSHIKTRMDLSYVLKSQFVTQNILQKFQEFVKNLVRNCGQDDRIVELPFKLNAIFGDTAFQVGSSEYFQPGFLFAIIFVMPMASALALIRDRNAGTLQRCQIAGVKLIHILAAFIATEGVLLALQVAVCFGCMVYVFGFQVQGSTPLFLLICYFQGLTGLSYGFLIGNYCNNELEGIYFTLGLYLPILVSSGITWPLESLSKWGSIICHLLPTTIPINAARSVSGRGWDIYNPQVYPAFFVMTIWMTIICTMAAFAYRQKQK